MSEENDAFEMDDRALKKLIKVFDQQAGSIEIGVLGSKAARENKKGQKGATNATVGAAHEFGTSTMPVRSFLRIPLSEKLQEYLDEAGAFNEEALHQILAEGSLEGWLARIGIVAENVVGAAFDSNGFGKWPAWKPGYSNNTGQILVDTKQLRDSISSRVVK